MAEGIQTVPGALPGGTQLERYVVEQLIERSDPFTLLYSARDVESGDAVQLVELYPSEFVTREGAEVRPRSEDVKRSFTWGLRGFVDQATALQRIEHPNIACVLRAFETNGTAYYVIAPEEGEPLTTLMARNKGGLSADLLVPLFNTLVDALEKIHSAGLMHWDLRPDTVLVNDKGQPLLIDFGAARHVMRFKCRSLATAVAAGYSAPEVYSPAGNFGPWTDIYSLAAIAYHAIARGAPPDAQARQRGEAPLRPAVKAGVGRYPEAFLEAVDWALRLDAAQRPQKLAEWREALAGRSKPPEMVGAPEYTEVTRPVEKRAVAAAVAAAEQAAPAVEAEAEPEARRSRAALFAIGAVALAVIGGGVYFTQKAEKPAEEFNVGSSDNAAPAAAAPTQSQQATSSAPAPGSQSVALDRLANQLMARQAQADEALNAAREQAAKAASAASAANANANTDKAEKERLQKAAAEAAAKEEAARAEAAKVKAELEKAEAEQRKKDEAALAAQQAAAQQAAQQAAAQQAAQQAAAPPPPAADKPAPAPAPQPAAPAPQPAAQQAAAPAPTPQQPTASAAAPASSAPSNTGPNRGNIFPPFANTNTPSQKSDAQLAADASSASVIAAARKNCKTAAADVAASGDLTYDRAKLMPNARVSSDGGSVTLPSVRMPDGRYALVIIDKDSCATVRGIRASP